MDDGTIVGIGPLSPPITGPGLKNKYIKTGLEGAGFSVVWVNTLERAPGTIADLARWIHDGNRFLVSASTKVRLGTAMLLARRLSRPEVRGALLPAGGAFATELSDLPPGIRGRYLDWFSRFDCILPEMNELATDLRDVFDGNVDVHTLPNPRPVPDAAPEFDSFAGADRPLRLVYLGRIKEQKGLHLLLSAVTGINDSCSHNRVSLDIYGHFLPGDEYRNRFLEQCETTPNATFFGKLEGDVIARLRDYDIFVFPTYYPGEGMPGALVEAFAGGCGITASDWNYNSELVSDGENGLLFEPESSTDLKLKIEWLLDNPESVDRFKRNSWEEACHYSIDSVINRLLDLLHRSGW